MIRSGNFSFPSLASVILSVVKEKAFDSQNGFRLETVSYGNVSAYYAGLAVGEVDTVAGGPHVFQRMRIQGVPIVVTNTIATLASLVLISRETDATGLADLQGDTLAADMGSSEYQVLRLLASREGFVLGEDISVLNASSSVARAHLQSAQVSGILTFEPSATLTLRDNPGFRIVFHGEEGWKQLTNRQGWLLVSLFREDWIRQSPNYLMAWIRALQAAVRFIRDRPEEADVIVSRAMGLPGGTLLSALEGERIAFKVLPSDQAAQDLNKMFEVAVEAGFVEHLPDAGAVYQNRSEVVE